MGITGQIPTGPVGALASPGGGHHAQAQQTQHHKPFD